MSTIQSTRKIGFRQITINDIPQSASLVAKSFSKFDPPAVALNLTMQDFEKFITAMLNDHKIQKLTTVAIDPKNNEIVGVLISETFGTDIHIEKSLLEKFGPIFQFLEELEKPYIDDIDVKTSIHQLMLATKTEMFGQGIATSLVLANNQAATQQGYKFAYTDATGIASQHIFKTKMNYDLLDSKVYSTFKFMGCPVFKSVLEPQACLLLKKRLIKC